MKKILAIIAILLLLAVIYVDISTCRVIERGYFSGRIVCYLTTITIESGTTNEVDVKLNNLWN